MSALAPRAARLPRGYVGGAHETIGSDIIAVFEAVLDVEATLGSHWMPLVRTLDPNGWYSIDLLLTLGDVISQRAGAAALAFMGEGIFKLSHERAFRERASSVGDLVFGIDAMYRRANRGSSIGGWRVLEFRPSCAVLEKTTPHHCQIDEGILRAAGQSLGVSLKIGQRRCLLSGHDTCDFVIEGAPGEPRWMGTWPAISAA